MVDGVNATTSDAPCPHGIDGAPAPWPARECIKCSRERNPRSRRLTHAKVYASASAVLAGCLCIVGSALYGIGVLAWRVARAAGAPW
jgi:hypothetical protein